MSEVDTAQQIKLAQHEFQQANYKFEFLLHLGKRSEDTPGLAEARANLEAARAALMNIGKERS
jgi:hypothetical protein